ncbi:MAG: helicase HerA-like domain-containing protein [Flavobacteriaceae bacterium]|nr:helicase HerA-like domain-containing protein [Flavobacteriaceae bacterium]
MSATTNPTEFIESIQSSYKPKGSFLHLGAGMLENETFGDAAVKIPLRSFNRHGLIAGATGTGKTKTLQIISEQLALQGVPVLMMDMKGDLSGIAAEGQANDKINERHAWLKIPYQQKAFPVELMNLSEEGGVQMRATVSEFGPVLLSRILDVTETQAGILSILFKYCDDHKMPLVDIKDLKEVINFALNEGRADFEVEYGSMSKASTGAILRKLVAIEQQGGDLFFGEPSFDPQDLLRKTTDGIGYCNILRLTDIQDKPALFSTFMLSLLAEIYSSFPEEGDSDKPKLVIFIDEAHLIFKEASKALLSQLESIVKLIRSKGVGLFFVTQNPTDVPESVLSQLGLKVQHALRAFTAKDRKAIKLAAENFPISDFYNTANELTTLGIGEAFVTGLDDKGRPTALVKTMLRAPMSRMDVLSKDEVNSINSSSALVAKYKNAYDSRSAHEILKEKIEQATQEEVVQKNKKERRAAQPTSRRSSTRMHPVVKVLTSATFIRGVMGILGKLTK